ncbi:hypothetical protein FDECE_7103 [Fusarium decemcellulare]|nr:hypothetical protein FDECE_7103 [Fusarium decemcellulare]
MARVGTRQMDSDIAKNPPRVRAVAGPTYTSIKRQRSKQQPSNGLPGFDAPGGGRLYVQLPAPVGFRTTSPVMPLAVMEHEMVEPTDLNCDTERPTCNVGGNSPGLRREAKMTHSNGLGVGKVHRIPGGGKPGISSVTQQNTRSPIKSNDPDNSTELAEPEDTQDDAEEPRYEVEAIIGHEKKGECEVDLRVRWAGYSESTLEDECTLQEDCPDELYGYWDKLGGRALATGIRELFYIFKILEWDPKENDFKVQWVGYPPSQYTWEPAWNVQQSAREMYTEFLKNHSATGKIQGRKQTRMT